MTNLDHKTSWGVFGFFVIIIFGIVGYYAYRFSCDINNSGANVVQSSVTTGSQNLNNTSQSTPSSVNTADTNTAEEVVNLFEKYHKIKDDNSIQKMFDLFTLPSNSDEQSQLDFLLGKDMKDLSVHPIRLNSTATFDYQLINYEVLDIQTEKCSTNSKCIGGSSTFKVKETRTENAGNTTDNRRDYEEIKYFVVVNQNGKYLIDQYYNETFYPENKKYDGFYIVSK